MRKTIAVLACLALQVTSLGAQAPKLGSIDFPTSGSPAAKPDFIRGMLFLHSFEYDSAAAAFRAAQQKDPRFVMAYWGEAMTYNHPVWNEQDLPRARAVLQRLAPTREARAALAPTVRERAWLETAEILYGEGTKEHRDTLFSTAMERIATGAPEDLEAQTLYALSLLGLSQGVRVIPTYMRAGAIALAAMQKNPDHPGAAHYAIHAFDDPIHASLGLRAAEAYSSIAPSASHAQHMTTHIFLALGMWDKVVKQNIVASGTDTTTWKPGHYTAWLLYGLLQQGRFSDAERLLKLMARNTAASDRVSRRAMLVLMRDYYLINTEQWGFAPPVVNIDSAWLMMRAVDVFSQGYAALKSSDLAQARSHMATLHAMTDSSESPAEVGALAYELAGLIHLSSGDTTQGLGLLRQATAIEDTLPMDFGPPLIVKPTHEALGEVYLQMGKPTEARQQFERALALAPRRMRSLLGLHRAAVAAGDTVVAAQALNELRSVLASADTTLPELREVSRSGH